MTKIINIFPGIETAKQNIRKQLLADDRVWVITFSGGKDSTLLLQLVMEILLELKKEGIEVSKKIYIISSDTKVEMPIMEAYHFKKMQQLRDFVEKENLNVEVKLVTPNVEDDFFVCMLGRGYPSPNLMTFRWCTDRIKIKPSTQFLQSVIDKYSSIVMLLGVRLDESAARANSINKREENERDFTINLFDKENKKMDILSSSSGQKQIIATALIWAISEYANTDMPMIIDTPLGRLDDKNQKLLLDNFYPNVAKQIIMLPTPSELRADGFKSIIENATIFKLSSNGSIAKVERV